VIKAVLTSEGVHANIKHLLDEMVKRVPDANPLKRSSPAEAGGTSRCLRHHLSLREPDRQHQASSRHATLEADIASAQAASRQQQRPLVSS
jgi:hypothetical protein